VDAAVLQYGALGLLAAVLVAVGAFLKSYLGREQDRAAERDRAAREDGRALNQAFSELVAKDIEAKAHLTAAMSDLCGEMASCQGGFKALAERIERSEQRAQRRHEQQMQQAAERHEEIVAALKALNGKRP
jgi:hypothetical protein